MLGRQAGSLSALADTGSPGAPGAVAVSGRWRPALTGAGRQASSPSGLDPGRLCTPSGDAGARTLGSLEKLLPACVTWMKRQTTRTGEQVIFTEDFRLENKTQLRLPRVAAQCWGADGELGLPGSSCRAKKGPPALAEAALAQLEERLLAEPEPACELWSGPLDVQL